jgi:two-component system nitrogen regulation response regulator NtrX
VAPHVLVIDDDDDIRESLVALLQSEGYQATAATSGAHALDILSDGHAPPAAILLDLRMPSMSGQDFAARIGDDPRWASTRIIICTAGRCPPELGGRAYAVLQKPFDLDRLLELVDNATNPRK